MKLSSFLLIILFFALPLVHGNFFPTIGWDVSIQVSGNFEFTKSIFFTIISSIIFFVFCIEYIFSKKQVSRGFSHTYILLCIASIFYLSLSTIISLSPFTSLIGDTQKGHTSMMIIGLIAICITILFQKPQNYKKIVYAMLLGGCISCLVAWKEYLFPSFDYRLLSSRALGTFGHPNYLAGYILILLPFTQYITYMWLKVFVCILFILTLFATQSVMGIILAIGYGIFLVYRSYSNSISHFQNKKIISSILLISFVCLCALGYYITLYYPEKLHSFLSRWYIWETTLHMIFSSAPSLLIGSGAETLSYYFESFKVPEMYIFENFGFTADRPHNLLLNIWYHFGGIGLVVMIYLSYIFLRHVISRPNPELYAIFLFLGYGIFHYFSIVSLLSIALCIAFYIHKNTIVVSTSKYTIALFLIITGILGYGGYNTTKLYQAEILYHQGKVSQAEATFSHPKYLIALGEYEQAKQREGITSQKNYRSQIISQPQKKQLCNSLIITYPSAENYIFCGNIFEQLGKDDLAKSYYTRGLEKLPDLWNLDSPYWDTYFVKTTITGNRFFSEKFGDIQNILDYLELQN